MEKSAKKLIGLTGLMGSGKGEAAAFFQRHGFRYLSLSDILRNEIRRRGLSVDRISMQEVGNELRRKEGTAVLACRIRQIISDSEHLKWVIDGIRNPAEVVELKKEKEFILLAIIARPELLVERLLVRGRDTDRLKPEELHRAIQRELGSGQDECGQLVGQCIKLADYWLENNGTIEEFIRRLEEFLGNLEKKDEN